MTRGDARGKATDADDVGNERTSKKNKKKTTVFVPSVSHNVLKVGGMHLIIMSTCKMCVLELYFVLFCLI